MTADTEEVDVPIDVEIGGRRIMTRSEKAAGPSCAVKPGSCVEAARCGMVGPIGP
jgi:hypothetical protein